MSSPFHEIEDRIWFIQGKNRGRYTFSNSLFINDRKKLLIDTGVGRSVLRKLIKEFGSPDIILYSHAHEDHLCNIKLFQVTPHIHEADKPMALSQEELFRIYGITSPELRAMLLAFFKTFHYEPLPAVNTFTDGQVFDTGSIEVKVLHAPGHSAGHSCFEIPPAQLIFSSDIDLATFGPWYGGLDSDIQAFEQSIATLIRKAPKILVTSHKGIYTEHIPEELELYRSKIDEKTQRLLTYLQEPHSFEEIVPQALMHGRFTEPLDYYLAAERVILNKHLTMLLDQGVVEVVGTKFHAV